MHRVKWTRIVKHIAIILVLALSSSLFLPRVSDAYAIKKAENEKLNSRKEIVELRTENSKTYIKGDGKTYIVEQYKEPIHYKENGHWTNIDSTVEEVSQEKALDPELPLKNKANQFKVGFAKHSQSKKLVRFQHGKTKVDFHLVDVPKVSVQTKDNTVTYPNVYPDTDLVYYVGSTGMKEEWILHKYNGKSSFTMGMNVQNAKAVPKKDGSIQFVDTNNKVLFTIPRPIMVDAKDVVSEDVKFELRTEGEKTYLDVKADEKWLQDPKRAYPVAIDPSFQIEGKYETFDAFVSENFPQDNYKTFYNLRTGNFSTNYGKTRSFIKFNLSPLLSGARITSATLKMYENATSSTEAVVGVYPITSSWDSGTITWANQPSVGTKVSDTTVVDLGWYEWNVTSLVQDWYQAKTKNLGFALKHEDESLPHKTYRSSDTPETDTVPKLVVEYTVSPLGQEAFWTSAVTNANTYNGNFYLPETDVQIPGRGIPASLVRSYNSQSNTSGLFGYGWTSNIEQHLYDSGDGPILYQDGDGTLHSFTPNGDGTYKTTQVLQLELTKNADGTYTLIDASQTQYLFTASGYLNKIIDTNGNTTTIAYSGVYPVTVTDASGRQLTITRDANNRISKVTDPANRTIEYGYNASGDLTNVTKKDASGTTLSTVTYEYETNHNLKSITDPNGSKRTVTYTADDKVDKLSYPITVGGAVQTATTSFAYDTVNKLTTVTDPKGIKTLYTHNDYGNVTQITQDPTGLNYKQTFVYNNENQLISQKDANTNAVNGSATYNYSYDANGNLKTVTNPLNETTTTEYDANNNAIKETDANGNTTTNEYDEKNNATSSTDASAKSSATKYDSYGNVIQSTSLMSPGNNLMNNGSVEIDRDTNSWPDDWDTKVGTATFSWASPGLTTEGVTLGSKSLKISNPQTSAAIASKLISYDPTKTYVFSGHVKAVNANGQAMIYVFGFKDGVYQNVALKSASITGDQDSTRLYAVIHPGDFPAGVNQLQLRAYVSAGGKVGDYYFDGLQVEEEHYGAYNVLENGDLERDSDPVDSIPDRWLAAGSTEVSAGVDGIDATEKHAGKNSFRLVGKSSYWKSLRQDVKVSGGIGSILTVSGFSKVQNPNPQGGIYGYIIETYSGTTKQETFTFNFDKSKSHDWQHRTAEIKATKAFDNIKVFYEYSQQAGTAWFDTAKVLVGPITTKYTYDANGNYETKTTDPLGRVTDITYDTVGNVKSEKVGSHTTSFGYDALDRLTQVTDAKTGVTKYEYDANGNKTKVINAKSKATSYVYNEINQVKQVTDANNKSVAYEYDITGNQTKTAYPNGNSVGFGYNAVGRQTSVSHNGTERYVFEYDANGNVTKETDKPNGKVTNFTYDADNKLKSIQETGNQSSFTYDKNGNVIERKHVVGSTTITHGFGYDSLNQLTKITSNGAIHGWFTFNEMNQQASRKTGDSTSTVNKYNGAGDLVEQIITDKNGSLVDSFKYTYDAKGNITSVVFKAGTTSYIYDELDQLIKETRPDGTIYEYTYDSVGNRLSKKVTQGGSSTTTNYTYDDADQLTAVNGSSYTYDANGNLTNDGQRTYVYDAESRLTAVKDSNGNIIASFTYRADGMRKTMTTATGTITFHYDENKNVTHETDSNGTVMASYTFDGLQPVSMTRGGQTYYYQLNGHGDVVGITNASGSVVASYEYDAFGNLTNEVGTLENPYRYAGYRYDKATGLYYLQSRYYNPETGRFLTRDTFDGFEEEPLSLNKYSYVHNNPIINIDPDGNCAKLVATRYGSYNTWTARFVAGVIFTILTFLRIRKAWAIASAIVAYAIGMSPDYTVYYKLYFYNNSCTRKIRLVWYYYRDSQRKKLIRTKDTGWYNPGY